MMSADDVEGKHLRMPLSVQQGERWLEITG